MMSESDLLNGALGLIGQSPITGITDTSPNGVWCARYYPPLRRAALRTHYWNFAEKRVQLTQAAVAPAFEFAYAYGLPADYIRIKEYNGSLVNLSAVDPAYWNTLLGRFKIEGNQLLTNDGEVKVVYTYDEDNPARWDPLFWQLMETWLASKLAMAITRDPGKSLKLMQDVINLLLPFAASVDSQDGYTTPYISDDLTWGR